MWGFADIVAKKLSNKKDNDERTADIDLRPSVIKPLHAKLLIKCHETLDRDHEFITQEFKACGHPMLNLTDKYITCMSFQSISC